MKSILVVDIGTTGIKCTIWQSSSTLDMLRNVYSTQTYATPISHPLQILRVIEKCFNEMMINRDEHIDFVGFSCFGMCLLGLDSSNNICSYATYRGNEMETTTNESELSRTRENFAQHFSLEAERDVHITASFLGDEISNSMTTNKVESEHQRLIVQPNIVGITQPFHPSYALNHMMTYHTERICRWTTIVSYCLEKWTGKEGIPISYSEASWFGMLDWKKKAWDVNCMKYLQDRAKGLPKLVDFNQFEFGLSDEFGKRWPSLAKAKLLLGIVDGAAATFGSCPVGEKCVTIGTSAAVRILMKMNLSFESVVNLPSQGCFVHVLDSDHLVVGGALTDGGSAVDLLVKLTGMNIVTVNDTISKRSALLTDENKIACLPYFSQSGERAPGWAGPNIPGAFVGINHTTQPIDLIVASAVGVALRLAEVVDILQKVTPSKNGNAERMYISGSALKKSLLWKKAIGGSVNTELWTVYDSDSEEDRDESSSRGVAMLALGKEVQQHMCKLVWNAPSSTEYGQFMHMKQLQRNIYQRLLRSMI
jgi:sugar (pentulose or hexulose) kinase